MSAPVETEPDVAPPAEKPVPVQELAFVEDQVRVALEPFSTLVGEAVSVAVGTAGVVTVTVFTSLAVPPTPVQVTVYAVVAVGLTERVPEVPTEPIP